MSETQTRGSEGPLFDYNLSGLSVAIGIPNYRGLFPCEVNSALVEACTKMQSMGISNALLTERDNSIVHHARNKIIHNYLVKTDFQKLLFLDDDIVFTWEDMERLLAWSTKYKVVCGAYPTREFPIKYFIKYDQKNPYVNEEGLLRIEGCGMGFVIIDRSVFDRPVTEYEFRGEMMKGFFDTQISSGKLHGEDMQFFRDYINDGGEVWMDPLIDLGHFGNHIFRGNFANHLSKQLLEGSSDG